MLKRALEILALASVVAACDPGSVLTRGPGSADDLVCIGNPDRGGVVCQPLPDLWDCSALPNGLQKCTRPGEVTPDGTAEWSCSHDGATVVCTAADASSVNGLSGWDCVSEGGVTTCTSTTGGGDSGLEAFPCSYAMIVFTYGGKMYVVKVPKGWTTCTFTNQTSSDTNFEYTCNGDTYDNPDFIFSRNGTPVPPYDGAGTCEELLSISGREVSAMPGVTILYAAAHNGSFQDHFASLCPPPEGTDHLTFPDTCS